jgi:hypothetical protein
VLKAGQQLTPVDRDRIDPFLNSDAAAGKRRDVEPAVRAALNDTASSSLSAANFSRRCAVPALSAR